MRDFPLISVFIFTHLGYGPCCSAEIEAGYRLLPGMNDLSTYELKVKKYVPTRSIRTTTYGESHVQKTLAAGSNADAPGWMSFKYE